MKKWVKSILSIVLAVATALTVGVTYVPQKVDAVTYQHNFDRTFVESWIPYSAANEWQIVDRSFPGLYGPQGLDVSQGFDMAANVTYTADQNVRMSNTIIGTGTENEFIMYTCIEPRVSWADILALNTIKCTNNSGKVDPPAWPDGGHVSYLLPEKNTALGYTVAVNLEYYATVNGRDITLARVTMYANTQDVPKGSIGIGNPLLSQKLPDGSFGSFMNLRQFDLNPGSTDYARIDISTLYSKYEFSTESIYSKTVVEKPRDYIEIYPGSFNYDGDSCNFSNGTITWDLPNEDLGLLPYTTVGGYTTPEGVLRVLENGKATYYRQEAFQRTYRFSLDVTKTDFVSGTSVQVTESPQDSSKAASIFYNVGESGPQLEGFLNPNTVKGLLYDLEFQKVVKDSSIPLEGVRFKLIRKAGDGSGTYSDTEREYTFQNGSEDPNVEVSKSDGSVKFKDMPWGYYELSEISLNSSDSFQQNYLINAGSGKLPRVIPALDSEATGSNAGTAAVGWVIRENNSDGKLKDIASSLPNKLYIFQPNEFNKREGFVENEPYCTEITVKKKIDKYDQLADSLKNTEFDIKTVGDNATYKYPSLADTTKTLFGENTASLKHGEQVTYKVMIPKDGADIDINELLAGDAKKSFAYKLTTVTGDKGTVTNNKTGVKVHAIPGYSGNPTAFTAEITNSPVTKLYIKKIIDNYQSELAKDEFMINVTNDSGSVDTGVVLKHNETTTAAIVITEAGTVSIDEIIPEEYEWVKNEVAAGNATVSGHDVSLDLGEEVTIAVHNKYNWQPYFHNFNTKANNFTHSKN